MGNEGRKETYRRKHGVGVGSVHGSLEAWNPVKEIFLQGGPLLGSWHVASTSVDLTCSLRGHSHLTFFQYNQKKKKGSAWDPFGFRQSRHRDPRGAVVFNFCFGRPQLITLFIFDPTSDGYAFFVSWIKLYCEY